MHIVYGWVSGVAWVGAAQGKRATASPLKSFYEQKRSSALVCVVHIFCSCIRTFATAVASYFYFLLLEMHFFKTPQNAAPRNVPPGWTTPLPQFFAPLGWMIQCVHLLLVNTQFYVIMMSLFWILLQIMHFKVQAKHFNCCFRN